MSDYPQIKRQNLQICVPDPQCTGCVKASLLIEIPEGWVLTSTKHKEGTTVGESIFDFNVGSQGQAHVVLESRSLGDELLHTPKELLKAEECAMRRRYWVRSFKGKTGDQAGKFVGDLTRFPLYLTRAQLSPKQPNPFRKFLAWLRREPPSQVWHTECFKFFRFQVILICIGPASEDHETHHALRLLSKQMTQALARYAAGRVF